MNSVPRKLTLGLALVIGAAACGDDVTVAPPGNTTPVVRSVVVSPSSATIAAGASFTFGAAVDADAGLARTVSWTASGGTGITVDPSTGVASTTAAATGVSSVCATSTADTQIKGCAQLTVNAVTPQQAATVQIDAVTVGCHPLNAALPGAGACGLLVPVQTNNVGGQIDVAVQINRPAGSGINTVKLDVLGGTNFATTEASYTQALTGDVIAQSDDLAAQTQTLNNRIVFSVQTAAYTIAANNVVTVKHVNGLKKLRVTLVGGSAATAQAETQLSFRNANGWHVAAAAANAPINANTSLTSGTNANLTCGAAASTACNIRTNAVANGLAWNGGTGLAITASSINFTGFPALGQAGIGTGVAFGSGCDVGPGALGARFSSAANTQLPSNAPANGSGSVVTGTLPYVNGAAAAAGTVNSYATSPAGACNAAGEVPTAAGVDASGNAFINFGLAGSFFGNVYNNAITPLDPTLPLAPAIRLDNAGPAAIAGYATGRNQVGADVCFGLFLNAANNFFNGAITPACPTPVAALQVGGAGPSINSTAQAAFVGGRIARQNGWVNSSVNFTALHANAVTQAGLVGATSDPNGAVSPSATVTGLPADVGIGNNTTLAARIGTCTTVATCATQPIRTNVTGLAETANGFSTGAIVQSIDAFGNLTNPPAVGANFTLIANPLDAANPYVANGVLFIGVDNTVPTIVVNGAAGTAATNNSIQAASNVNWNISADDQAAALPAIASGVLSSPGNELYASVSRRDGASTQWFCPVGPQIQPSGNACGTVAGWATGTQTFNQNAGAVLSDVAAANIGYHILSVFTRDQAGNQSAVTSRDFIFDNTQPQAFGPSFSPGVFPATGNVTFTGSMTEDLDAARAVFTVRYPLLTGAAASTPVVIRSAWTNKTTGLANPVGYLAAGPSALSLTLSQAMQSIRSIELVTGGGTINPATTQAAAAPNLYEFQGWNVARLVSATTVSTAIGFGQTGLSGATVANPGALGFWALQQAGPANQFTNMTWAMGVPTVATPIKASGNAGAGQVNTKVITAIATGVSGPLQAPFAGGVKFYVVDPAQNVGIGGGTAGVALVEACTAGSPLNDQVTNTWTYSCTYAPSTLLQNYDLFGYNFANSANLNGAAANGGFPAANTTIFPVLAIGYTAAGEGLATVASVNAAFSVIRP